MFPCSSVTLWSGSVTFAVIWYIRWNPAPRIRPSGPPSFAWCEGYIVIECMLTGGENMAARLRIRSTSSFGPEKPKLVEWVSIRFEQVSRGMITVSCFLDRLSKPQVPPTILLNEQQTSIMRKTTRNTVPILKANFYNWNKLTTDGLR